MAEEITRLKFELNVANDEAKRFRLLHLESTERFNTLEKQQSEAATVKTGVDELKAQIVDYRLHAEESLKHEKTLKTALKLSQEKSKKESDKAKAEMQEMKEELKNSKSELEKSKAELAKLNAKWKRILDLVNTPSES